ncbi:hypothetical protein [Cumulibacter soli]|uniref:phosphatase domain-containing protein n=1 Tax=Cumulibacter soli TaxID=2546344 RepID=UPI003C7B9FE7
MEDTSSSKLTRPRSPACSSPSPGMCSMTLYGVHDVGTWVTARHRSATQASRDRILITMSWPNGPGVVVYPDGARVRGKGLRRPLTSSELPDWTLYLLPHEPDTATATNQSWLRWRDFWIPSDRDQARGLLHEAYRRARSGQRVDITCTGGRGRTGTAIACIAQFAGVEPDHAVRWTRHAYHPRAVETPWQRRYVRCFLGR